MLGGGSTHAQKEFLGLNVREELSLDHQRNLLFRSHLSWVRRDALERGGLHHDLPDGHQLNELIGYLVVVTVAFQSDGVGQEVLYLLKDLSEVYLRSRIVQNEIYLLERVWLVESDSIPVV